MILSADPSLLGLGFGVTGTVDAPNIDRAFFALRSQGPALPAVTCGHLGGASLDGLAANFRSPTSHRRLLSAAGVVA